MPALFSPTIASVQVDECTISITQVITVQDITCPQVPKCMHYEGNANAHTYARVTSNVRVSSSFTPRTRPMPTLDSRRLRTHTLITQGSIPGCVRYRDFVEAMEGEVCSSHNGRANATGEGGSVRSRNIESRNNPGKEQQRRSSADDIEHLVDRLKEVRTCFKVLDCANRCVQIPYVDVSLIASMHHTQMSPKASHTSRMGESDRYRKETTTFFNVPRWHILKNWQH